MRPEKLLKEFNYFAKQDIKDIWQNFRYPNVARLNELSPEEQDTLKEILEKSAQSTLEKFKEINRFIQNFRTIYNKYKHTPSEITGMFGIDQEIQSHIFVRHKEDGRTSF